MGSLERNLPENQRRNSDEATERRFNETVRNLLNTPPKPYKSGKASSSDGGQNKAKRQGGLDQAMAELIEEARDVRAEIAGLRRGSSPSDRGGRSDP
jgi:hypothetical protein